ncbi:hypothetical protein N7540_011418 [Penicillium herquei]|nr:hypothetical protein N7540_011418 [Penicillium herquei]
MSFENTEGAAAAVNAVTNCLSLTALPNSEMEISLMSNSQSGAEGTGEPVESDDPEAPSSLDTPTLETTTEKIEKGEDTAEENSQKEPDLFLEQPASLFCPKNGRLHSTLLDFGITSCLKCEQDLTVKVLSVDSDTSSTVPDSEPNEEDVTSQNEDNEEKDTGPIVSHAVEFRDSGGNFITTETWPGPFDLHEARNGISNPDASNSVLQILTVLGTSIKSDRHRASYEVRGILEAGILHNRRISVNIVATKILLFSKPAIRAIRSLVHYYPSASLDAEHIELSSPYTLIAHYLKDLESLRAECHETDAIQSPSLTTIEDGVLSTPTCDKDTFEHLGILLDFVKENVFKRNIEEEEKRHTQSLCTFRMLWLLFKPGDTVYVESGGRLGAYVVQSVEVDESIMAPGRLWYKPYKITVWNLAFDGTFVGRKNYKHYISYFEGERSITALTTFPSTFLDQKDNGETRQKLEDRGQKWYGLLRGAQMNYDGRIMSSSKGRFTGRVYVDTSSYYSQNCVELDVGNVNDIGEGLSNCPCEECHGRRPHPPAQFPWGKYDFLDPEVTDSLVDEGSPHGAKHRYLICEGFVYGFLLKSKQWEKLDMEFLIPPKPNLKAMESLVMPKDRKLMIKALVQKFSKANNGKGSSKSWGADFIDSKGEAEFTGRALLSLTCGDIGTDEVEIEKRLSQWFRLAEKWGAVMLLDEADVFLERRMISDLKRNSLVSVFLRCMEYYQGILFLTTNRVGHFDDAFVSRIHVVIRYDNLGANDRKEIWSRFFAKLSNERQDFEVTQRAKKFILSQYALDDMEWNGREIRNVFQTAVALAEYRFSQKTDKTELDGPVLDQEDFEQVCNMTQEFKHYLTNIYGRDEEERAEAVNARFDERLSGQDAAPEELEPMRKRGGRKYLGNL